MNKTLFIGAALLSLMVTSPVFAATFSAGQTYNLDKQTTVNDDLYAAAGSPIVSGTILGDTMVAGGNITFNGSTKNLMAAGGTITLLGTVSGSIRAVGGTITISSPVGADVVVAGGTINILQTTVGRDVAIAGGQINLDGTVARNATIRGGDVRLDGTINGNVDVQASQSFKLGEHAVIKGNLTYSAPAEVTKAAGAVVTGETIYTPTKNTAKDRNLAGFLAALVSLFLVVKVLAIGTAVVIATTVFKRTTESATLSTIENFWKNIVLGFVALIIVPIACIALFVSVFGLAIGAAALLVYLLLAVMAKIFVSIIAGAFLSKWYKKEAIVDWKWALVGLVVVGIVSLVPIVGWVVSAVLFLAAFGTLASLAYHAIDDAR